LPTFAHNEFVKNLNAEVIKPICHERIEIIEVIRVDSLRGTDHRIGDASESAAPRLWVGAFKIKRRRQPNCRHHVIVTIAFAPQLRTVPDPIKKELHYLFRVVNR